MKLNLMDNLRMSVYPPGTEHRGRVVNTPPSYSGGRRFKSWPRLPSISFFVVYSVPPDECWDSTLKLGNMASYQILSNLSSFTYHPIINSV
jgi:hypothetical protein